MFTDLDIRRVNIRNTTLRMVHYLSAPKMVQILVILSSIGGNGTVGDAVKLSNRHLDAFCSFAASMGTSYDPELEC